MDLRRDSQSMGPTIEDAARRQAIAIAQHQRVMEEAAFVAELQAQALRRAGARPVYARNDLPLDVRTRVRWEPARSG